jgi:MFS family permease
MFSVVDIMEIPIVTEAIGGTDSQLYMRMQIIEPIVATFFILIAGFLCDLIGRKKVILSGFVSLGAAYAIVGFLGQFADEIVWYLYFVVDGAAWGIFYLTFVLIVWGDLSQHAHIDKYYALGSVPFFISYIIAEFVEIPKIEGEMLYFAFSVAAFFLFVAVMPLVFAPETLPEKKMELRRLRSFAEEAQKAKEKYERKS